MTLYQSGFMMEVPESRAIQNNQAAFPTPVLLSGKDLQNSSQHNGYRSDRSYHVPLPDFDWIENNNLTSSHLRDEYILKQKSNPSTPEKEPETTTDPDVSYRNGGDAGNTRRTESQYRRSFLKWQTRMERQYARRQTVWFRRWNDRLLIFLAYLTGIVGFMVFFHVPSLPKLPFPVTGNLADWNANFSPYVWWHEGAVLVLVLWGFTHLRRILIVVISAGLSKQYDVNEPPEHLSVALQKGTCVLVFVYHVIFGVWMGWANNTYVGYLISDIYFVVIGLVLFAAGEAITSVGSCYFMCKREKETRAFRNARLVADVMVWLGVFFVSMTLASLLVFMVRLVTVVYIAKLPERPHCC